LRKALPVKDAGRDAGKLEGYRSIGEKRRVRGELKVMKIGMCARDYPYEGLGKGVSVQIRGI